MAEYHVGCGLAGIYAGTLKKNGREWQSKSDVTNEAIDSVRDYLRIGITGDQGSNGFEWKTKDGKIVTLMLTIKEATK